MGIRHLPDGTVSATIRLKDKWKYIGRFDSEQEARAALEGAKERVKAGGLPIPEQVSIRDFSTLIEVCEGTIVRWISEGMPVLRTGKTVRINSQAAQDWISANRKDSIAFSRRSFVYFAERERDGAIKIGWSSAIERRLPEIRKVERCNVELLASYPGKKGDELALHERFSSHRIDGEWFYPHRDILSFVFDIGSRVA